MSKSQISPEEAHELEREIDDFVRQTHFSNREFLDHHPIGFEKDLLQALSRRDAEFFHKLAKLCEMRTPVWVHKNSGLGLVTFLARQHKKRLIERGKPITRPSIRKLVEQEWAALMSGFDPSQTGWGKVINARSEYERILRLELGGKNGAHLQKALSNQMGWFAEDVWKRVWQDPELSDVLNGKPGRPRKTTSSK
jgi:hypothetical protein